MSSHFIFRKNTSIGNLDAALDEFLDNCFIETDAFNVLSTFYEDNPDDSRKRIIVGRTGSGKTALLRKIAKKDNLKVGSIEAQSTVFEHIDNNVFISKLSQNHIDLKMFYKALWVHVLLVKAIELLYADKNNFFDAFTEWLRTSKLQRDMIERCRRYVNDNKDKFFNEQMLTELTDKLQSNVSAKIGGELLGADANLNSEQQKKTQSETNHYINTEILKTQKEIIDFLVANDLTDRQKRIVISIDDLDRTWISSSNIRYDFINALLEATKELLNIKTVKILVSIRVDILKGVYANGLRQREKDKTLFLPIEWTKSEIRTVLDTRIDFLIKDQYVKNHKATFSELFSFTIGGENADEYVISRTMLRPRDAIDFVNLCFNKADGETELNERHVIEAEESFFISRKDAICDEWKPFLPHIRQYIDALYFVKTRQFNEQSITVVDEQKMHETLINSLTANDSAITGVSEGNYSEILKMWFMVGLIGIIKSKDVVIYSCFEKPELDITDLDKDFIIHPLFWRR